MKSNFLNLQNINPSLFKVAYSAEQLFVNNQFDYIPTALRLFAEGIMKEIVINPGYSSDLNSLIQQFSFENPVSSYVTGSAHDLRISGNKASHFVPVILSRQSLIKLFKSAVSLQN
jgi:hypothetical protein